MTDTKEFRVFGPPGTGKSTYVSRQVEHACEKYGPHRVLVASFTRAAVAELVQRRLPIPPENLGTLHALCYRALDAPEIAETGKHFKEFSEEYPQWSLAEGTRDSLDDGYSTGNAQNRGDEYLREYARLRNLMRPRELWPAATKEFASAWENFKKENALMDFTDLIETAWRDLDYPPGLPDVGFIDEAQDLKPLEFALVRKWGEKMETLVVVGDEDQAVYQWCGSDPANLLTPLPPENIKILKQSYRVPRAVHAFAEKLIEKIPAEDRQPKEYLPRDADGSIRRFPSSFKNPEQLIRLAQRYVEQDKSVLFLASCSYMLTPLIEALRTAGLPFSNPYRRRRRDWNPLHSVKDQLGALERVQAFFEAFQSWDLPLWTPDQLRKWAEITKGVLHRGGKEKLYNMGGEQKVPGKDLLEIMPLTALTAAQKGGLDWLETVLNKQWERSARYAIEVLKREPERGGGEPKIQVGTVHSVKGGEADTVILSPDLSPQGMNTLLSGSRGRGEIIRLFYVGVTRARESLILTAPGGRMCIPWW